MAFNVGEIVAHIKADVSNFEAGMNSAKQEVTKFSTKLGDFGKDMATLGAKATLFAAPVTLFFKSASDEAMNLEKALTTLDIISERFGVSGDKAKQAAQDLGKELRIGVGSAAAGLQNLLKAGLSLDQATDLMKRFTNEAITGKSNSISLAQAVENLTFAYTTNNSAIGNLSGINENFQDIIDKGRQALLDEGMAANKITDDMAKYRGMIDLTNLTMGSAERFHGTLIDKQAELGQQLTDLKVSFGQLINPILMELVTWLISVFNWVNSLNETQKQWIVIIGALIIAIGPALTIFGLMVTGISAIINILGVLISTITFLAANPLVWVVVAIAAVIAAGVWLVKHWDEVKAAASALGKWVSDRWNDLQNTLRAVGGRILDAIMWPFEEAKRRIQDAVNFIKDRLDFTQRHSPSVLDIVQRGVKLVNNALEDLPGSFDIAPKAAIATAATGIGQQMTASIQILMDGAIIADQSGAKRMAEMMGDQLVDKLKKNVRF